MFLLLKAPFILTESAKFMAAVTTLMHKHFVLNELEHIVGVGGGVVRLRLQEQLLLFNPKLQQILAHCLRLCYSTLFRVPSSWNDFHGIFLFGDLCSQGTTISELLGRQAPRLEFEAKHSDDTFIPHCLH